MKRPGAGDAAALARDLKAGRVAPVYFLHGEEAFLKEEAARRIRDSALGKAGTAELSWSLTVLEGGTATLSEILDAARTLPMLSPRRMVLVKDAERIREADAGPLKGYLKDPSPTTCLVFQTGADKPDLRKAVFRALQEGARALEFPALRDASVLKFIRDRVRERKGEIEPDAEVLLQAHLGSDLFRIDQELAKVLEFLAPSRKITPEALGEVLGAAAAGSVFEMAERVGAGDRDEAVRLLRGILADGEEPVRLLFLIARQFRNLILGKELMKKGRKGNELARALGVPPYPKIVEKTERLVSGFPESAGAPAMRRILEADRSIKGGLAKGPAVLERLVLDLASLVGRQGGAEGRPA